MLEQLNLERPIAFFDIESTGTNPERDRIIEIAVTKIMPDGTSRSAVRRLNPGIPIPPESTEVHGIKDEDVAECPKFEDIAQKLYAFLADCDFGGYNITKFDIPILENEFNRAGIEADFNDRNALDVFNIYAKLYPHTLEGAYRFFCGKDLIGAHGAAADNNATIEVLLGQLAKHPEMPSNVKDLAAFGNSINSAYVDKTRKFKWACGEAVINFSKHQGRTLRDIAENEPSFLQWILRGDFSREVKQIARDALQNKFPTKPTGDDKK
ncbi:MAG: hypothetical protein MJ025_04520 [Victivallaceae bacterium]|nr:hypothetical protein [Victivallaceae bacterium]